MQAEILKSFLGEKLEGPLLLSPTIFRDERGFFFESWNQLQWKEILRSVSQEFDGFVQDNHSRSEKGVLRGLHYQIQPKAQGKLVRCISGEIYDVAVDLRLNSDTYLQSVGVHLSSENQRQFWLPVGFAHGFLTLSDYADVLYKTTDFWSKDCERSINWNDPQLAITWHQFGCKPLLSDKDSVAPFLQEINESELF
tara:strand:- start:64 stop:651 length:588 start_codon:yes stop_codon:yes gene_type:complete